MELAQLQTILEKNPTIYTYSAEELIKDPARVEEKYRLHAKTHISLPDLQQYEDRLLANLLQNQSAFMGGLFGEYGLGKTSTLLHLWTVCEDNGVLAVPPYDWRHFSENYEVLYHWARHRIGQTNPALVHDLDKLHSKYTGPSIDKLAKEAAEKYGLPFDQAQAFIQKQWDTGILRPELPEEAYLDFLAEIADLAKLAHFKGVIVFHDELQVPVEALSLSKVADILFRLSANMMDRNGCYGLFVGMPLSTQTALLAERKDIFDRLQRQRCFIDLSVVYTLDFPQRLWQSYAARFDFTAFSDGIVPTDTLEAIGQICNPGRRDLGNGPRSVISAFNRIVQHYLDKGVPYSVVQFVEDCIKGEIVMGQESKFAKNVSDTLGQPFVKGRYERLVKAMAAFPLGAAETLFDRLDLKADLAEVVQKAFGDVVYENANGYALVCLRAVQGVANVAFLETKIRQFHRTYAVDPQNAALALEGFKNHILPAIFSTKDGMHGFQAADGTKPWSWALLNGWQSTILEGTFDSTLDYPQRLLRVTVAQSGGGAVAATPEEDFSARFNLTWKNDEGGTGTSANLDEWMVAFQLDLSQVVPGYTIPTLAPGILPAGHMTPLFLLALCEHLRTKANVPKTEERELKFVLDDIVSKVTVRLFNTDHQMVHNTDIKVDTIGRRLVADVFWNLCKKRFKNYRTLITQAQWQKKIGEYTRVLELGRMTLNVARGDDPYDPGPDMEVSAKRQKLGQLLGVNASSIEAWGAGLKDLIDMSRAKTDGTVTFKVHPLELEILEMIRACPDDQRIKVTGKMCQAADGIEIIKRCRALGYTEDEIQAVMGQLGQARQFFKLTPRNGRPFVYYDPVSTEELRAELAQKVIALRTRVDNLKSVRGFTDQTSDMPALESAIPKLQSVEEYEKIKQPIHGHFERINRWIATTFTDFARELESQIKARQQDVTGLEASGQLAPLKQKLDGQAVWIPDLAKLQAQLNASYERIRSDWQGLVKAAQQLIEIGQSWAQDRVEIAKVGDKELMQYQEQIQQQIQGVDDFTARFKTLRQDIVAYAQWARLRSVSDQGWQTVLACQSLGDTALVPAFESLAESVREHLQKYQRDGLKDSERFLKDVQELQAKAEHFRTEQRRVFLSQKDAFQNLLKSVQANVSVLRSQFADNNPSGSYNDLYDETCAGFHVVVQELISAFAQLQNDLQYASEYLQREKVVNETQLLSRAQQGRQSAQQLAGTTILPAHGAAAFDHLAATILSLREEFGLVLNLYRQNVIKPEAPSPAEQQLIDLLVKGEKDLKEVILALSAEQQGIELAAILEMMTTLFRKNQLVIKVRRSG